MVIIENLDLRSVSPGRYELIALPLRIREGDGSPGAPTKVAAGAYDAGVSIVGIGIDNADKIRAFRDRMSLLRNFRA